VFNRASIHSLTLLVGDSLSFDFEDDIYLFHDPDWNGVADELTYVI